MKKGVIGLIILLALIIIVSPGIIGKMAEKSVGENLSRAADETGELVVTTSGFDGGWFSSEGEHRIEIGEGSVRDAFTSMNGDSAGDLPVLVINTRMDHGIIPVTSMSREKGSLAPGLGNAVSTMKVEMGDGEVVEVPGTIYSDVALNGDLTSQYLLDAGGRDVDDGRVEWQDTTIEVIADASSQGYEFSGEIGGFKVLEDQQVVSLGKATFNGEQTPSGYGFFVGDLEANLDGMTVSEDGVPSVTLGGIDISGTTGVDGDRVQSDVTMNFGGLMVPGFGDVSYDLQMDINADAAAFGTLMTALENMQDDGDPAQMMAEVQGPAMDMFAAGMDLNFTQFDVALPMGTVEASMSFSTPEQDRDSFAWTSLLLKGKANVDMKIPEALVEMATSMNPQAGFVVASGYLRKEGEFYILDADMEQGLLTVNGAPIPIPMGMF